MKMFHRFIRLPILCRTLSNSSNSSHYKVSPRDVGISLVKTREKFEDECAYSSFRQFNVETKDRYHYFSVPCDRVIKFIKLGVFNKQIASQYCHYLAELTRTSQTPDDVAYYSSRCNDLLSYVLRIQKDIPPIIISKLLSDVTDTTKENCLNVFPWLFQGTDLRPGFGAAEFAQLLGSFYRFGLWEQANLIIERAPPKLISFRVTDMLVQGIINSSKEYKRLEIQGDEREAIKSGVLKSLAKFCKHSGFSRAQMVAKNKDDFIKALKDLDFKIRANPSLKMTGRCTSCDTYLPLFDPKKVFTINSVIRSQLSLGSDKGIFLNTSPNDVGRFETFLQDLYEKDRRPLDCVIDGLNIAYRSATGFNVYQRNLNAEVSRTFKVLKPETQSNVLINCIIRGDMLKHFKKILVVGKWHMTKWPGLIDFFKKHNIHFYSSFNSSKDDLFQLYAATLHPKTFLITNDFLRDHLAQLDEENRTLLERWIDTHQVWICQKTLKPIWPTPFEKIPCASPEGDVFHLPVIDFHQLETVGVSEPPPHLSNKILTWICCDSRADADKTNKI